MSSTTSHPDQRAADAQAPRPVALLAEFREVGCLLNGAAAVRQSGYTRWDCLTPFPIHRLDKVMGNPTTRLPWLVFVAGLVGCVTGVVLTWYTMATDFEWVPNFVRGYPFVVSGKPLFSLPAYIPPIFELTILFAAFAAVFGMLGSNGLPQLYHPYFRSERFRRVTADRFFIAIEVDDPKYDPQATADLLRSAGAVHIEIVED
jgi:hypothetical protein